MVTYVRRVGYCCEMSDARSAHVDASIQSLLSGVGYDWQRLHVYSPHRIGVTLGRMLHDREYVPLEDADARSSDVVGCECVTIVANGMERIFVWMMDYGTKMGVSHVRSIHEAMTLTNTELIPRTIIITTDGVTSTAKRMVESASVRTELFTVDEMKTNRIYHKIQPTFRKLSAAEIDKVIDKYGIERDDSWTVMRCNDFVCRYFDWPEGVIIECERCFQGIHQIFYRRVGVARPAPVEAA